VLNKYSPSASIISPLTFPISFIAIAMTRLTSFGILYDAGHISHRRAPELVSHIGFLCTVICPLVNKVKRITKEYCHGHAAEAT
jgi:hypothetical protein